MANTTEQRVAEQLAHLPSEGFDALKRLIWTTLNYDRIDTPLSTRTWPQTAQEALHGTPRLLAANSGGGFHVIVAQLARDHPGRTTPLSLGAERRIVTQLLADHPYALFIFTDPDARHWHFVNVSYQREAPLAGGEAPAMQTAAGSAPPSAENAPPPAESPPPPAQPVIRRIAVGPDDPHLRTAVERIAMLDLASLDAGAGASAPAIQQRHDAAFDVEAVTQAFFTAYRETFERAEAQITGLDDPEELRLFTQRLFNRLLFIVFLERKGWLTLGGRTDYLRALWEAYRDAPLKGEANFYRDRLKLLFFSGLNNPANTDIVGIHAKGPIPERIGQVPYLNGGLFEQAALDRREGVSVPDAVLADAIESLLTHYNFTVTESTPLDVEVAVDPEMLGRIFEELVTGRHESGSYYTRKPIVAFMCREALKGYLADVCPREEADALAAFVDHRDATGIRAPEAILAALRTVRVCDPACGSGAYLVGMLHELMDLRQALFVTHATEANAVYDRKLETIQNCLYGVDIDPFAVNIARLRLWLSLIVEYEGATPPPLPNLAYKIEVGDSLTGPAPEQLQPNLFHHQTVQDYCELKTAFLTAHGAGKRALRDKITALQAEIAEWAGGDRYPGAFDWTVQFAEIFMPEVAGAATLTGEMTGVVNAAAGQMQLAPRVGRPPGFDILVMNPPYVRQELLTAEQKERFKAVYPEVYRGTADLYVYFYARALHLLREGGVASIISSNKWMRARYGEPVRKHLAGSTEIEVLIDFGDLPVFNAAAYPMIGVLRKRAPLQEHKLRALEVDEIYVVDRLQETVNKEAWHQPQTSLRATAWQLVIPATRRLLDKLRSECITLGETVQEGIYYGIKTGYNRAFVIDEATRNEILDDDPKSQGVIKPWLRGRDVKRWRIEWSHQYLIAMQNSDDESADWPWKHTVSEEEARTLFQETYPAIYRHLKQHENRLRKRWDQGKHWWELRACAYYDRFASSKIVWPDIAKHCSFTMDNSGYYPDCTLFALPTTEEHLLGLLNSKLVGWFYTHISPTIRGSFLRFKPTYLQKVPIPSITNEQRRDIKDLVEGLLDAEGTEAHAEVLERDLNALVYELYDLTPDEIALIEKETRAARADL